MVGSPGRSGVRVNPFARRWRIRSRRRGGPRLHADHHADVGVFVTSGGYTAEAQRFAHRSDMRLIDGAEQERMISPVQKSPASAIPSIDISREPAGRDVT